MKLWVFGLQAAAPGIFGWPEWRLSLFAGTALAQSAATRRAELQAIHTAVVEPLLRKSPALFGGGGGGGGGGGRFGFDRLLWIFGMHISRWSS